MNVRVRRAQRSDAETLLQLVNALAEYEKLDPPTHAAQQRLIRDGWPDSGEARFSAWIAEGLDSTGGQASPLGYAITFFTYSSFLARPTLYIEDIFILPEHRRSGAGTVLFKAITTAAKEAGCGRVEWVVLSWNTMAQQFYNKLGAKHLNDWQYYRLELDTE